VKSKKILIWVLLLLLVLFLYLILNSAVWEGKLPFYVYFIAVAALILPAVAVAYLPRLARLNDVKNAAVAAGYTVKKKGFTLMLERANRSLWLFVAPRVGAGKTVCFINHHQYFTFLLIRADNRGRGIFRNPAKNVKRADTAAFTDVVNIPVDGVSADKIVLFARMTNLYHVIIHKEEQPLKPGGEAFGMRVTDVEHLSQIL